ncbi:MAG TPA: aminotransferase class I/II-fold pyridoxal phosphate-dependent enzyme, partial [Saprospiraceae bacterium]|nr:aminotransferase class I/II-fold pyridoxal phosphate-dependent enzyme [Saprospiraceae bacterium]
YIDTIMTFKSNMDSAMFKPIQEAAAVALNLGQDWIEALNNQYAERKKAACDIMSLLGCSFQEDGAGLFVWGKIPENAGDSEALANKILYQTRVFITPGHIFGSQGDQYLRISLCSPVEDMNAALYRIQTGFVNLGL